MITVHQSKTEIGFRVENKIFQQVSRWAYAIDEAVFREQLTTGLFGSHEIGDDLLGIMRQVEKQGKIMPYYGVGGSSGSCTYNFRVTPLLCHLKAEHGYTRLNTEFSATTEKSLSSVSQGNERRFKFSPFPYLTDEKLPNEWSGEPSQALVCIIMGKEFQTLSKWHNWNPEIALTERYEYSFGEVSMGVTGFVAKVKDSVTDLKIDITDYDDW